MELEPLGGNMENKLSKKKFGKKFWKIFRKKNPKFLQKTSEKTQCLFMKRGAANLIKSIG